MSKFNDHLWQDLVRDHSHTLANTDRSGSSRARAARPRAIAGGTLGIAAAATAAILLLSGGPAASPAFGVTTNSNGSLTINLDAPDQGFVGTNAYLKAHGDDEHINFTMAEGPASSPAAVSCVAQGTVSGPPVALTVGSDSTNTETVATGNTGGGVYHVASCERYPGAQVPTIADVNANGSTSTQAVTVPTTTTP